MSQSSIIQWVLTGAVGFIVACGGAPEPSAQAGAFAGTWSCSGAQVENCPNGTHVDEFVFSLTTTAGGGGSVLAAVTSATDTTTGTVYTGGGGFPLAFTIVDGNTATLDGPQTEPTGPGSLGGAWTPTYTVGTLTQTGSSLTWTDSGSGLFVDGFTETCGFTQNYTCARE
jgi:hypothetical protein